MITVKIEPSGLAFEAESGETLMAAAKRQGYYWPTTCGGNGECTTCACTIEDGAKNVSDLGRFESKSLQAGRGRAAVQGGLRLGCQTRVYGDVTVRKPGVRAPGA
jgi:2Fe-2S ferredoxin